MTRTFDYTYTTVTITPLGGYSRSLSVIPRQTLMSMTRSSKPPYFILSVANLSRMRVTMKDREDFLRDPIFFFVALAIADNAFRSISSLDQFWAVRPPRNTRQFEFQWKSAVKDLPILRISSRDSKDTTSEAWTYGSMAQGLNKLTQISGYPQGTLTMTSFRRGFANCLDSE